MTKVDPYSMKYYNNYKNTFTASASYPPPGTTWKTGDSIFQAGSTTVGTTGTYTRNINLPWTEDTIKVDPAIMEEPVKPKVPLFADARTIKAVLQAQVKILEDLQDGLEGEAGGNISDAIYYLNESINSLEKI